MKTHNLYHFNISKLLYKFLLLSVGCFLLTCSQKNNTKQILSSENHIRISESAININTASAKELEKLPNIGAKTAQTIIEHRTKFGNFRKPEHLLLVGGISDKKFRELRSLIKVE